MLEFVQPTQNVIAARVAVLMENNRMRPQWLGYAYKRRLAEMDLPRALDPTRGGLSEFWEFEHHALVGGGLHVDRSIERRNRGV